MLNLFGKITEKMSDLIEDILWHKTKFLRKYETYSN